MLDRFETILLMDYYSCLLTDKQLKIMNMYFNEDLSLAEISEITDTTRQAIHDLIKRCEKQLKVYEEKLQLLQKNYIRNKRKEELLDSLENRFNLDSKLLDNIEKSIDDIINA
ncbi:putative DNA-binding protein [Clostridium fallax]|uniref:UPF0122 protein SAMN05443638_10632 n=1 Tax=Clostridium fallax TaxID=1533 RepID=A0A1M4UW66_9CLOT|nr:putative DNA-binding protein [Clostridium fallax]SHE60986.1 hypothetical protein SAMN05443638_10632 [Clostridium fallax]SQB06832.1 DNA-binding protein [Clostridium fallax]